MKTTIKKRNPSYFKPGQSGNPAGRPVGTRNKITLLRQSLELTLRERSEGKLPAILEKAMELALDGDKQMIKLMLDLHMSRGAAEETKAQEKVSITIGSVKEGPTTPVLVSDSITIEGETIQ